MSKKVLAVICVVLGVTSVSFAEGVDEPVSAFTVGGMVDPYSGPTPSGMRFGDGGHVLTVQTGDVEGDDELGVNGCQMCRFGIYGVPCDPDWRGPCVDWKLVGWYSSFRDKNVLWCEKDHSCGLGCGHGCGHGCGRCGRCGRCGHCRGCQSCCH